jgi:hypothetical protein
MRVVLISREDWLRDFARNAHLAVFDEDTSFEEGSFTTTMLVIDEKTDTPIIYMTYHEVPQGGVFVEYGGSFPPFRSSPKVYRAFNFANDWFRSNGYKRVGMITRNTNTAMNKLAIHAGYLVVGMQFQKGKFYLEHNKALQGE